MTNSGRSHSSSPTPPRVCRWANLRRLDRRRRPLTRRCGDGGSLRTSMRVTVCFLERTNSLRSDRPPHAREKTGFPPKSVYLFKRDERTVVSTINTAGDSTSVPEPSGIHLGHDRGTARILQPAPFLGEAAFGRRLFNRVKRTRPVLRRRDRLEPSHEERILRT